MCDELYSTCHPAEFNLGFVNYYDGFANILRQRSVIGFLNIQRDLTLIL